MKKFKLVAYFLLATAMVTLSGCAITPKPQIDMSSYSKPTTGTAGVYFYQWKTGIFGALSDVKLVIDDKVLGSVNTGEWMYLEVPAGAHKYNMTNGMGALKINLSFAEGGNYFFRGQLVNFSDTVYLINDEQEVAEVIKNMESGRYKKIVAEK